MGINMDSPADPPDKSPDTPTSAKTELAVSRKNRLAASVSEFLLLFKLRARRVPAPAATVMQRAVHMVLVTCHNWFGLKPSKSKSEPPPSRRG